MTPANTGNSADTDLIKAALAARLNAYAPYSNYQVGAAILTETGKIVSGCNVENASYGLCNCAERTAIFGAVADEGPGMRVRACAVATDDGGTPCGPCRQVLAEFAPDNDEPLRVLLVDKTGRVACETTLAELLPMAFTLRGARAEAE